MNKKLYSVASLCRKIGFGIALSAFASGSFPHLVAQEVHFDFDGAGEDLDMPEWGIEVAWVSPDNIRQSKVHMGEEEIDVIFANFYTEHPVLEGGELHPDSKAWIDNQVALPVFNAFKLFAQLEPTRVEATSTGMLSSEEIIENSVRNDPDIGIVATKSENGTLKILVWNYHDVADKFDEPTQVSLKITGLIDQYALDRASITRVDEYNANAFTAWRNLGEPQAPLPKHIAILHDTAKLKAEPLEIKQSDSKRLDINFHLLRQSVALIEIPVE